MVSEWVEERSLCVQSPACCNRYFDISFLLKKYGKRVHGAFAKRDREAVMFTCWTLGRTTGALQFFVNRRFRCFSECHVSRLEMEIGCQKIDGRHKMKSESQGIVMIRSKTLCFHSTSLKETSKIHFLLETDATSRVEYVLTQIIIKLFHKMRLGHRIELN